MCEEQIERFCYLGSLEPTFILKHTNIDVNIHLKQLRRLCKSFSSTEFLKLMGKLMITADLPRRDETLFVFAVYLIADLDDSNWRYIVREAFPEIIIDEMDLFMFLKYATLVQKVRGHSSWVPRTVRKALVKWYINQSVLSLHNMLTSRLRRYGFSHRVILKLCHIPDKKFNDDTLPLIRKFFRDGNINKTTKKTKTDVISTTDNPSDITHSSTLTLPFKNLRTIKDLGEASDLIHRYQLNAEHVPKCLLNKEQIFTALIEQMTIPEILRNWRFIVRNHFYNFSVINGVRKALSDIDKLRECNLHPINYLYYDHRIQMRMPHDVENILKAMEKKREVLHLLRHIYPRTFGLNKPLGLRMHITVNLDKNYQKKIVNGSDKKMHYQEAMIGLALGYFKVEKDIKIGHWNQKGKIRPLEWIKSMTINEATKLVNRRSIRKAKQILSAPILNALEKKEVYDVFLILIPKQHPKYDKKAIKTLTRDLKNYQSALDCKARYILVNVCFTKKSSMSLANPTTDILEISGLHEHTTRLIAEYAIGSFN